MADFYSREAPAATKPATKRDGSTQNAKLRRTLNTFICDATGVGAAAAASRLMLTPIPKGARGVYHVLSVSATMGGVATLALGIAGNTGKYRAAATLTANETVKKATILDDELAADVEQFLTVAAAALPNGGEILAVETFYTLDD
jgi:hypothetical protein